MKTKILFFQLFLLFIFTRPVYAQEENWFLYKGKVLANSFVYDGPTYKSNRIGSVNRGEILEVYQDVVNWEEQETFRVVIYKGNWGYVPYYNVEVTDIYNNKTINSNKINAYGFISLEGNLKNESYKDLILTYMLIPNYIRSLFQIEGFTLRMTEKDVQYEVYGDEGYDGVLRAVFDYDVKKLWINDENVRYVLHEVGHYVNDRLRMFAQRPENKKIYKTESLKTSLYSKQNVNEYYAECFDMYFRCPSLLKFLSPLSYEMVEKSLNEFYDIAKNTLPKELL